MSLYDDLSAGDDCPDTFNVVIEIPAYSEPVKYEFDKDTGLLEVDRFTSTAMQYPCNYGFVPHTLSEDGDPVDVLVVTPVPLRHGCVIKARAVGVLNMTDESGIDAKILAVPVDKLTPLYRDMQQAEELPSLLLQQIEHFFQHYKDLEPSKWVKTDGWADAQAARDEISRSYQRCQQNNPTKENQHV